MIGKCGIGQCILGLFLGAVVGLAGCDDKGVTPITTYPTVTITTPNDGDELVEDVLVLMEGLVVDDSFEDELEQLDPLWSVDGVEVCTESTVDSNGETNCSHSFEAKEGVTITLKVTNPTGGASEYDVVVDVLENNIPQVSLVQPVDTRTYYSDRKVDFEAQVSDAEDDPEDLVVTWTSDLDGTLTELEKPPTSAGTHAGAVRLSKGEHRIEVLVTDTGGKTNSDSVSITVGDPNTPPICSIDLPADGAVLAFAESVEFKGTATDNEILETDLYVRWSSSIDGVLYTGNPNSAGESRFNYSALSQNNHIITLLVEDDVGAACEATISVKVGSKPTLTLIEPVGGDVFNEGETVFFRANVYDVETSFTDLDLT